MATLTIQDAPVGGLADVVFAAADVAGDDVSTGAGVALLVKNDDAASHDVTIATPGTVRGLAIEDPTVAVPAGAVGVIPLIAQVFSSTATITYPTGITSVSVAAVRLAR